MGPDTVAIDFQAHTSMCVTVTCRSFPPKVDPNSSFVETRLYIVAFFKQVSMGFGSPNEKFMFILSQTNCKFIKLGRKIVRM